MILSVRTSLIPFNPAFFICSLQFLMFKSSINRVLCVLYTQILFFGSLICMGLVLITGSVVSVSNKYWNCTVLNIYYTDAWLCLVIGIFQVLLGTGLGLYVYLQPKCAKKGTLYSFFFLLHIQIDVHQLLIRKYQTSLILGQCMGLQRRKL